MPGPQGEFMKPFLVEEVWVAVKGLNGEVARGEDSLPVFFYIEFWEMAQTNVMDPMEEFR